MALTVNINMTLFHSGLPLFLPRFSFFYSPISRESIIFPETGSLEGSKVERNTLTHIYIYIYIGRKRVREELNLPRFVALLTANFYFTSSKLRGRLEKQKPDPGLPNKWATIGLTVFHSFFFLPSFNLNFPRCSGADCVNPFRKCMTQAKSKNAKPTSLSCLGRKFFVWTCLDTSR